MKQDNKPHAQAKGGVAIICFSIVIIGQIYLLRNVLFKGVLPSIPTAIYIELAFWLVLVAGIVICFISPQGWKTKWGIAIALGLFVLYAAFSIITYSTFQAAYLTGINAEFDSTGGAIVGFKLFIALIGVTAAIPVAPKIDDREYARRLREKVYQQQAEWAKASVKGAKKDLEDTVEKLKATLSKEELEALLKELQTSVGEADANDSAPSEGSSVSEDFRGWGGGM